MYKFGTITALMSAPCIKLTRQQGSGAKEGTEPADSIHQAECMRCRGELLGNMIDECVSVAVARVWYEEL